MSGSTIVFADGACSGNPGPGGWGAIVALASGDVIELGGSEKQTTNNRMELTAILEALSWLLKIAPEKWGVAVKIHSDSKYVLDGIQKWTYGWKRNGWKTSGTGEDVKNRDLWEKLDDLVDQVKSKNSIQWVHVAGHAGVPGNERVDEIAVAFAQEEDAGLFSGERADYEVDLTVMKTAFSGPKKDPYYLSLVNGQIHRDKTWKECESRVRGQRGVKYKKCHSPEEEKEILSSWGVKTPS